MATIKVTQTKSSIGRLPKHKACLKGLGLRKINHWGVLCCPNRCWALFHNIFNVHEFELYERGVIIEPSSGCDCYFGYDCKREKSCMYDISVQDVLTNIAVLNQNLKK